MAASAQCLPNEATTYIKKIRDVFGHIEVRVARFPREKATLALIQSHIQDELLPECRRHLEILDRLDRNPLQSGLDSASWRVECSNQFRLCYQLIIDTVDLFNLLQVGSEDEEEFDSLNAEWGKLYIKGGKPSRHHVRDTVKLERIRKQFIEILAPWLGLARTDTPEQDPEYQMLYKLLSPRTVTTALVEAVFDQFQPRYIHKYPDSEVPYKLDHYADPVGGSSGIVRKYTREETGDVVAIKTIKNTSTKRDRKVFLRELAVLEVCDHPNLMRLVDAFQTKDNKVHLVLTPWAPFTLNDFISYSDDRLATSCPWFRPKSTESNSVVSRVLFELSDGIRHLHRKAIKHKDIKPDNILLHLENSNQVRPIITDFGKSKVYSNGAHTDYVFSTWQFLAPEQLKKRESSLKSDVWQLGCCFALVLGRACGGYAALEALDPRYNHSDPDDLACNIAQEIDAFLECLSGICETQPGVLDVTRGMLDKDPVTRSTIERVCEEMQGLARTN